MTGFGSQCFYFLHAFNLPFAGDCGKAWQKKIPERSEDDFFPANQPGGLPCTIGGKKATFAGKK